MEECWFPGLKLGFLQKQKPVYDEQEWKVSEGFARGKIKTLRLSHTKRVELSKAEDSLKIEGEFIANHTTLLYGNSMKIM